MSNIFKRFAVVLLVLTMVVSLAACKKVEKSAAEKALETKAVSVGSHTLSAVMLNYFFMDAVTDWYSNYGASLGLDVSKPLNQQVINESTGKTWADSFMEMALDNIRSTYALYDLAMANNFALPKEDMLALDSTVTELESMIAYYVKLYKEMGYDYPYANAAEYLEAVYGAGATAENYMEYCRICTYADAYYTAYGDSLSYTGQQLLDFEKEQPERYNSYSFTVYYLSASDFDSAEKAKDAADQLAAGSYTDKAAFDEAIKALSINTGKDRPTLSNAYTSVLYANITGDYAQWLADSARVVGDMGVIAKASSVDSAVSGYYVVRFDGMNDNREFMKTVRHILLAYEGGILDTTTGEMNYTDTEKAAVKLKAEKLLMEYRTGAMTELQFSSLADKHSDAADAPEGGLYKNVYRGKLDPAVESWVFDPARNSGDNTLVEGETGWHLLYFVGNSEISFRDQMITNDLKVEDISAWYQALMEKMTINLLDDSFVNKALVLNNL